MIATPCHWSQSICAALDSSRQTARTLADKTCSAANRGLRDCSFPPGRRACLQHLRDAALADTTRFLNAALAHGARH